MATLQLTREYDDLTAGWRAALDAALSALTANDHTLRTDELQVLLSHLAAEVEPTERMLRALARDWEMSESVLGPTVSPWGRCGDTRCGLA